MIYEKYAIMTDGKETSLKIIDLFYNYMAVNLYELLACDIILVDTTNGVDDWKVIIKNELGIDVTILPINELKFDEDAPKVLNEGLQSFIKKADISDDIDYFLGLISEKGGEVWLSGKERQRLQELSGNKLN